MSRSVDENVVLTVSFLAKKAQRGPGPPHSWGFWITQNYTSQSVGRLSTEERPVAKTSAWQHTTLTRTRQTSMPPAGLFFLWNPYLVFCSYYLRTCFFVLIVLACSFVFTVQHTTQTSLHLRRDSNHQSQQMSGRKPSTWTARSLGPTPKNIEKYNVLLCSKVPWPYTNK